MPCVCGVMNYMPTLFKHAKSSFNIFTCRFLCGLEFLSFIARWSRICFYQSSPVRIYSIRKIISVLVGDVIHLKKAFGCFSIIHFVEDGDWWRILMSLLEPAGPKYACQNHRSWEAAASSMIVGCLLSPLMDWPRPATWKFAHA